MTPVPTETTSLTRAFDMQESSEAEDFLGTLPSNSKPQDTSQSTTNPTNGNMNQFATNDTLVIVNNANINAIGTSIRVASLNCWGLYIYPSRSARYEAIGKHILTSNYDVVTLQEVWIQSDRLKLVEAVKATYPHNHYFKSGFMGSGLLILSRHPIERAGWFRYSINGQPQMIYHGDWYAGKGVGVCRIRIGGINLSNNGNAVNTNQTTSFVVDVYNTHLHAEYDKKSREYELHQLSQLIEYRRLVEALSMSSNVPFIATGDLNCFPDSFVYRAGIKENCLSYHYKSSSERRCLADAWADAKERIHPHDSEAGHTFNLASSSYYMAKKPGQRIDYIHYNPSNMIPLKSEVIVKHQGVTLSDHGLINSEFVVLPKDTITNTEQEVPSPFMDRQLKDQLNEQFQFLYQRDMNSLRIRQVILRVTSIVMTIIFLALFILSIVMVMASIGSGLAQATVITISPLPLAISIITGLMSELGVSEERAALIAFERDWYYWYMDN